MKAFKPTKPQIEALSDALPDGVTSAELKSLATQIASAVTRYRADVVREKAYRDQLPGKQQRWGRLIKHSESLLQTLRQDTSDDHHLRMLLEPHLTDAVQGWRELLRVSTRPAKVGKSPGPPLDAAMYWLGVRLVTAYVAIGLPILMGRDTTFVEVLKVGRQWAEEGAGRRPAKVNAYLFAKEALRRYLL
jgi:hypothetical protein